LTVSAKYGAFLSYSHADRRWADWLHGALEGYRVPRTIAGRPSADGPIPDCLSPVFRDREELAAAQDLSKEIRAALAASKALIVLCSPAAAASRWTNAEIEQYRSLYPGRPVLAAIVEGEPFASELPGRAAEECFPPALRQRFDAEGKPTGERHEPIAADLREGGDGKRLGLMKLIAGLLGVPLDEMTQREAHRRQRRLTIIAVAAIIGMLFATVLATIAIRARNEAWHQREQAEALVGFMLGDLRTRLEPVGRLDVLDAVGTRVLAYYQGQSSGDLSDEALSQRSRALTLIGEIANRRGDLDGALARYREALAGTEEALRRAPNDAQRIFDHAQNVYWVANIAYQRGQVGEAEVGFRAYGDLAQRLLAIDAAKPEWRLEAVYADSNLGLVLIESGRYQAAERTYASALAATEQLRASSPGNAEYRNTESTALAYLADAREGAGRLEEAIATRERQLRLLDAAAVADPNDLAITRHAVTSRRALGRLFASRGNLEAALRYLGEATARAQVLREREPANMEWLRYAAAVDTDLGELLLLNNRAEEAGRAARAACAGAQQLMARDATVQTSRRLMRNCYILRGRIAAAQGYSREALALARQAVAMSPASETGIAAGDRGFVTARARLLEGEQQARLSDSAAASAAWQAGLSALPGNAESPLMRALRYSLLRRLGRASEAQSIANSLDEIGYRHPAYIADTRS
jgi:tetratricopeptide (TPR) repeat protein